MTFTLSIQTISGPNVNQPPNITIGGLQLNPPNIIDILGTSYPFNFPGIQLVVLNPKIDPFNPGFILSNDFYCNFTYDPYNVPINQTYDATLEYFEGDMSIKLMLCPPGMTVLFITNNFLYFSFPAYKSSLIRLMSEIGCGGEFRQWLMNPNFYGISPYNNYYTNYILIGSTGTQFGKGYEYFNFNSSDSGSISLSAEVTQSQLLSNRGKDLRNL